MAVKKVFYFVPAIFGLVFYSLLAVFSGFGAIHPAVWLCIVALFVSAVLMSKKKWYGCIPGVLVGAILMRTPPRNDSRTDEVRHLDR